jgi:hypothetical protein
MAAGATAQVDRASLLRAPLVVGATAAVGLGLVRVLDVSQTPVLPPCPFLALTGLWCPFCGGTRALDALVAGDVGAALGLNVLLVLAVPLVVAEWARWTSGRARGRPTRFFDVSSRTIAVVATIALVYAVVRNLPGMEALTPGG